MNIHTTGADINGDSLVITEQDSRQHRPNALMKLKTAIVVTIVSTK